MSDFTQADLMVNGDICQSCGVELGTGQGFPRYCRSCNQKIIAAASERRGNVKCPLCLRVIHVSGVKSHVRDRHKIDAGVMPSLMKFLDPKLGLELYPKPARDSIFVQTLPEEVRCI